MKKRNIIAVICSATMLLCPVTAFAGETEALVPVPVPDVQEEYVREEADDAAYKPGDKQQETANPGGSIAWSKVNGKVYLNIDGAPATGIVQIAPVFDDDFDWVKYFRSGHEGYFYYFGNDGIMRTGWQKVHGHWYYFASDGKMTTGWQKIGGKWYYLKEAKYMVDGIGIMQTGWIKSGGKWYYLAASGAMQTGWQKIGGKWYFLNASGAMQTGWLKDGGKWYYLKLNGIMAANETVVIGGKSYTFNGIGVWVK